MDFDLVIQGGTVVSSEDSRLADVGILGEKIAAVAPGLQGKQTLQAEGMLVLPGGIDPHVHLEMPVGATRSSDDWESGTTAAAAGGTTTILDFVEPEPGQPLLEALAARRSLAEGRAVIDYGLHMTLMDAQPETLAQIPGVMEAGCPSFKTYLVYEGFRLEDAEFLSVLQAVSEVGGLVLVHAENQALVDYCTERLLSEGKTAPRYHPVSRPWQAEAEAVQRALALAEIAGARLYVVHLSTAAGAEALSKARRRGLEMLGETCPQYLLLTEGEYEHPGFEGAKYVCSPPLRMAQDAAQLWDSLATGDLSVVGTDHCPFLFHGQKDLGRESFAEIPGGLPGIEARLALLYTYGVSAGRLTLQRWVDACSTAPARIFGLYPRKGEITPGADADVVIFDPELEVTLSSERLHEQVDYTPYDGFQIKGYPAFTFSRGQRLVSEGEFVGRAGHGRFLVR